MDRPGVHAAYMRGHPSNGRNDISGRCASRRRPAIHGPRLWPYYQPPYIRGAFPFQGVRFDFSASLCGPWADSFLEDMKVSFYLYRRHLTHFRRYSSVTQMPILAEQGSGLKCMSPSRSSNTQGLGVGRMAKVSEIERVVLT